MVGGTTQGDVMRSILLIAFLLVSTVAHADGADTSKYALIMSTGPAPSDKDLLIVQRQGQIYSFKYCKAFNPAPVPEVIRIRRDFYLEPEKYKSTSTNLDLILQELYASAACKTVGNEAYGVNERFGLNEDERSEDYADTWISGIMTLPLSFASLAFIRQMVDEIRKGRVEQNTQKAFAYLFSKRFPHGSAALALGVLGAAAGTGYWTYHSYVKNDAIAAANEAKETHLEALRAGSVVRFYQNTRAVFVADSMADFFKNFQAGLDFAVKNRLFTEL
jgi:hypothetical protein